MISNEFLIKYNDSIKTVAQNISEHCVDPLTNFTRKRKLMSDTVLRFVIQLQAKSMNSELCDYFLDFDKMPTNSAMIQQRDKIKHSAFKEVNKVFINSLSTFKKYKDYYLLATDGSDINISFDPNDKDTFRENGKNKPYSQFHLNAIYDCLNNIYWDFSIDTATKKRECDALKEMAMENNYPQKSILILDRGYEKYELIVWFIENSQKFLIRVKDITSSNSILSNLSNIEEDEFDIDIEKKLTKKQTKETKNGEYTILPSNSTIDCFNEDGIYNLNLRVIRFKLTDNTYECLVTNLDRNEFSFEDLKSCYATRWRIENSYRQLKYAVSMIYFHSKKRNLIKQEIAASIILFNLTYLITDSVDIQQPKNNKYVYKPCFTTAVTNVRMWLRSYITEEELIKRIQNYLVPIRPDRSYRRDVKPQSVRDFNHRAA